MNRYSQISEGLRLRHAVLTAAALVIALALAGCSGFGSGGSGPREATHSRTAGDGRADYQGGIRLNNLFRGPGGSGLPVNALLWRASLDTLSVIPLATVDTFGGTIITEWYAHPEDPSRRIKVSVFVLDQELRSDGVKAEVYVQERPGGASEWADAGRDTGLATRLEDLILTRAREIRSSGVSESN